MIIKRSLIEKKIERCKENKEVGKQQGSNPYVDFTIGHVYVWYNRLLKYVVFTKNPHSEYANFDDYVFVGMLLNSQFRPCSFNDRPYSRVKRGS